MSLWSEITSFRAVSIRHDFHLVNYGPLRCKICDKAECAVERGCLVIDKWVHVLWLSAGSDQDPVHLWPLYMGEAVCIAYKGHQ